ncbi:MAG: MltA-interacting MipA family protein [Desulfobulbus sp.]|jgi:hypothetical protein|uniref:TorF family putative porin n=1 Tax=Desulfobulbus sp. TaxID=895 RepID=UPI00283F04CC|nr:TorF family putative porin [Desulfobulbus sp.]MDR2549432.1 MltA-interacting MipA family protein [Desulfobulbus sp.]
MKRLFSVATFGALTMTITAPPAEAATATAALDANSAYVWRGLTANHGFVLQPSIDVAAENGFGVNVWANFDVDDYNGTVEESRFSEVDLTASYMYKLGKVDTSVGVIAYTFPTTHPDALNGEPKDLNNTSEIFLGLGYDLGYGFSLSGKIYYDFDQVDDFYLTVGLGYAYGINDKTTLNLSGLISFAGEDFSEYYAAGTDSGFFNYTLSASVKYMATEALGIGANINFTDSMDDDVLPEEAVHTNVFGGISLTYAF